MNDLIRWLEAQEIRASVEGWFSTHVLALDNMVQATLIALAVLIGLILGPRLRRIATPALEHRSRGPGVPGLTARLAELSTPIAIMALLWVAVAAAETQLFGNHLTRTAASLGSAWVVIRLVSGVIRNETLSRLTAWTAWILAALATLGLFEATIAFLGAMAISFGEIRISALDVIQSAVAVGVLLAIALPATRLLERRIGHASNLTPSVQVLVVKLVRIALVVLAFLIAIGSLGIDLTALTVFGGALGIGIGFGLQRIVSNLISGLILLTDKSIKPNDVIAVGDTYGWIVSLGARYAAVRTRDGVEHLIPNEDMIIQKVENWTHSDTAVRLRIPVGISYQSDVRQAMDLCVKAAAAAERVLTEPEPRCHLFGFGDSSVNLEIRIWIRDPSNGRANVISEVLLGVWDLFHEHGIEFPFPQRDLHLRSSDVALPGMAASPAT